MNRQVTELIKKYNLHADDVYVHQTEGFKIIKRRGYKKIQAALDINIKFSVPHAGADFAVVVAEGEMATWDGKQYIRRSSIGEANANNNTFPYPVNVAQKRAEGRLILEMANLYQEGWMAEEEIDFTMKAKTIKQKAADTAAQSNQATLNALGI